MAEPNDDDQGNEETTFVPTSLDAILSRPQRDAQGRFLKANGAGNDDGGTETTLETDAETHTDEGEGAKPDAGEGAGEAQQTAAGGGAASDKSGKGAGKGKTQVPLAASLDDRDKRQDAVKDRDAAVARADTLQKELDALKADKAAPPQTIAQGAQQRPAPQTRTAQPANGQQRQRVSVFEDEEAFETRIRQETRDETLAEADRLNFESRIALSEEMTRDKNPDFDEVMGMELVRDEDGDKVPRYKAWIELRQRRPDLNAGFRKSANPVRYAYEQVKKDREAQAATDPDARKKEEDRIRADERAKILAENGKGQGAGGANGTTTSTVKPQTQKPAGEQPPKSIANGRAAAAAGRKGSDFSGPTPMDQIVSQIGKVPGGRF